jgi:aminopeptidase N
VHEAQFGGIPVRVYAFGEHQQSAEALLQTALEALRAFTGLFGPYPYETLAIVEMDFADGSESDGLFFMGRDFFEEYSGDSQNYLTTLTAHEISHQWWYGLAGSDSAEEPWLDEALATYSEMLFYENAYPDLVDWWWNFRITRFNPSGFVDSSIRDYEEFAPYVQAVYFRGALFLRDLRALMGDEAFFAFLRDYAAEGTGGRVDRQGFFRLVGQHTDADLTPLLGEYFSAAGE